MSLELVFALVAVLVGLAIAIVLLLPATTSTTVEVRFDAPVQAVWQVYTDFESQPNWRSDIGKVEMADDKTAWTETLKSSGIIVRFRILEQTPSSRLVLQTGAEGNFEGRYVAEFRQQQGGTIGVFTEETTALAIVPKVMRRLFFNQRKFIEEFAKEAKAEIRRRESNEVQR